MALKVKLIANTMMLGEFESQINNWFAEAEKKGYKIIQTWFVGGIFCIQYLEPIPAIKDNNSN